MPDEIQNNDLSESPEGVDSSIKPAGGTDDAAEIAPQFSLAEDLLLLEKLNLLSAISVRMQGGRHPKPAIEAVLKRRMQFSDEDGIQGPYLVRLICTVMFVFVCASLFWAFLWLIASSLELNYFIRLLSTGISTVIAAMAGVAIFYPSSLPDEKKLKEAIKKRLEELREQLKKENGEADSENEAPTDTDGLKQTETNIPEKPLANYDDLAAGSKVNEDAAKLALEGTENFEP